MKSDAERSLRIEGLKKSYPLGKQRIEVLRGISLRVRPGEVCAIMGPSGVGKTTLLNCIAGLEPADEGSIAVTGQKMGKSDDERTELRRHGIGVIYQFFNLVPNLTVEENVALPYYIRGTAPVSAAIEQALEEVGMTKRRSHYPSELSGGEMQLTSIARAVVLRPPLILADEPTGNLNMATGRNIMDRLTAITRETQCALVLVTHNPDDASRADRVLFMQDGRFERDNTLRRRDMQSGVLTTQDVCARLSQLSI